LERVLKLSGFNLSVDEVLNTAKIITTMKIKLPLSGKTLTGTMLLTSKHKSIEPLFDKKIGKNFQGDALSKSGKKQYEPSDSFMI
jgi:hypothetical protein